jgi:hypothetical protein
MSPEGRFDQQLQATITLFSQMFGAGFFKNAMLVFTKFG